MRYSVSAILLAVATILPTMTAQGQEPSPQARLAARRELEQAKIELRYYWQVEYPRQCRELDAAIELTRTDIDNNKSLLREYQPFTRFSTGQPFPITMRNLHICIKAAELRLNDLLAERNALVRFHSDRFRVLSAQVYEARLRVMELESAVAESVAAAKLLPAPQ